MQVLFPESVVFLLIIGALVLTGIGFLSLLLLLMRDRKNKSIW